MSVTKTRTTGYTLKHDDCAGSERSIKLDIDETNLVLTDEEGDQVSIHCNMWGSVLASMDELIKSEKGDTK